MEREVALADPATRKFAEKNGELIIMYSSDRRVVMYPTSNNQILNFVCIHPENESDATGDWNSDANKSTLLEVYKDFHPDCLKLLDKAEPSSLKVWKLLDMAVLPSWIDDRLALLGDAAHPFLPHQGQGGACAIEDAASLGVVLERGITREEVPARLALYEKIRCERANRIQEYTRIAGRDVQHDKKLNSKFCSAGYFHKINHGSRLTNDLHSNRIHKLQLRPRRNPQLNPTPPRMEMGPNPQRLLAHAHRLRPNAWPATITLRRRQSRHRINLHHRLRQIQNLPNNPPKPLSPRPKRLALQIPRHSSIRLILTDNSQQNGMARRVGIPSYRPIYPRRRICQGRRADPQRDIHARLIRIAGRPNYLRAGRARHAETVQRD